MPREKDRIRERKLERERERERTGESKGRQWRGQGFSNYDAVVRTPSA